jgi:CHU_C Type IX secretion signal domain
MKRLLTIVFSSFIYFAFGQVPVNNECQTAVNLGKAPSCTNTIYSNQNATATNIGDNNNPFCTSDGNVTKDVWFSFIASDTIFDYTISIKSTATGGIVKPNVNIYRGGCGLGNLIKICPNSPTIANGEYTFNLYGLTPGEIYYIRVSDESSAGNFTVCVTEIKSLTIDQGLTTACAGILYDDGGPNGNYADNKKHVFKICPTDAHKCIKLDFTYYNIGKTDFSGAGDIISVYDGDGTTAPLVGTIDKPAAKGDNYGGVSKTFYAGAGCMTVEFITDGEKNFEGFEAQWQCSPDECLPTKPIVVNENTTPQQIINSVSANGALVKLDTIICDKRSYATFTGLKSDLGMDKGLILSSGDAALASDPGDTFASLNISTPGDEDLDKLSTLKSNDACVVEFEVFASTDELNFEYVFGSEEYPEFVNTTFNDIFAFLISGPGIVPDPVLGNKKNMAIIPNTTNAVEINSVNSTQNWQYYRDNGEGTSTVYDGLTSDKLGIKKTLTARSSVIPCNIYKLKMAIADRGDGAYDSGVFVSDIKGAAPEIAFISPNKIDYLIEKCSGINDKVKISLFKPAATAQTYVVKIGGSATQNTDYTIGIPSTITFPAGTQELTFPLLPIADNTVEGVETITITLSRDFGCGSIDLVTKVININDQLNVKINAGADTVIICKNLDGKQVEATGATFYTWTPASYFNNPQIEDPVVNPPVSSYIYVTGQVGTCVGKDTMWAEVFDPQVSIKALSDTIVCEGEYIKLQAINNTNNQGITWNPVFINFEPNANAPTVQFKADFTFPVSVTIEKGGCSATDAIEVTVNPINMPFTVPDTTVCQGYPIVLGGTTFGTSTFEWSPAEGLDNPKKTNAVAKPKKSTTYILTGTSVDGTCTAKDTVVVNVIENSVEITGKDTVRICKGDSLTLTAVTSGAVNSSNFQWSSKNINIKDKSKATTKGWVWKSGWVYVDYKNSGCLSRDSVYVAKDSLPLDLSLKAIKPDQPYCKGDTVLLYSNSVLKPQYPNATFMWTEPVKTAISPLTNVNLLLIAQKSGSYIRMTSNGACVRKDTFKMTVLDVIPPIGLKDTAICSSQKVQLNITNAKDYTELSWNPKEGLSCSNCPNPIASVGVYTVTGKVDGKCPANSTITISPKDKPIVITPNDPTICKGQPINIQLGLATTGVSNIKWTPTTGLSCTDCPNPIATQLGTYTITGIVNTCNSEKSVTVSEIDTTMILKINGDLCTSQSVNIILENEKLFSNLNWTPATNLSCNNCPNPTTNKAGTYTITANRGKCKASGKVVVPDSKAVVLDLIKITPNDPTICKGQPINIQLGLTTTGVTNIKWTPATGLSCTDCPNPIATQLGTYKITGVVGNCNAESSITVSEIDPTIKLSVDGKLCEKDTVSIKFDNPLGFSNLVWSPAANLNLANPTAPKTTVAGTYTLTANKGKCPSSSSVAVEVSGAEKIINVTPATADVCAGTVISVQINATTPNLTNIVWTPSQGLTCNNCATPIANAANTYTITGNIGACKASGKVTINSVAIPLDLVADGKVCGDKKAILSVSNGNLFVPSTFVWSGGTPSADKKTNTVAQAGTYSLTANTISGNCSVTKSVTVTSGTPTALSITADPSILLAPTTNTVKLTVNGDANFDPTKTISWSSAQSSSGVSANIEIDNGKLPFVKDSTSIKGVYTVTGESKDGCPATAAITIYQFQHPFVVVPETQGEQNIFTVIRFPFDVAEVDEIRIFNRWSKVVYTATSIRDRKEAITKAWKGDDNGDGNFVPADVYFFTIKARLKNTNEVVKTTGEVMVIR